MLRICEKLDDEKLVEDVILHLFVGMDIMSDLGAT